MSEDYGKYRIVTPLGKGRLTEAFRARSVGVEGFEKTLVLKRFLPRFSESSPELQALLEEAKLSMRLSHANVAQLFDLGYTPERRPYFATEFVPGLSLAELQRASEEQKRVLAPGLSVYIAAEVAKALDHAHRAQDEHGKPLGLVHAALTPSNVMVSWEGEVKVTDFALHRALFAREALAPQAAGDLEALGRLLVRLLLGSDVAAVGPLVAQSLLERHPSLEGAQAERLALSLAAGLSGLESAASFYEALMEQSFALRAQATGEALGEFVEAFRSVGPTQPPKAFEGALERRVESLLPEVTVLRQSPRPAQDGELAVAVSLRCSDAQGAAQAAEVARVRLEQYGARARFSSGREVELVYRLGQEPAAAAMLAVRAALEALSLAVGVDPAASAGLELGYLSFSAEQTVEDDDGARLLFASARALSLAQAGRLALSGELAEAVRACFELEAVEGDEAVWLVGAVRPRHSATRFVGRKAELGELGKQLVQAVRGSLASAAVLGEGGVGKSRLVREMRRRLKKGTVSVGFYLVNCRPDASGVPFSAMSDMLRKVCGVRERAAGNWAQLVQPRLRSLGLREDEVQSVLVALGARPSSPQPTTRAALHSAVGRMLRGLSLERPHVFAWDRAEYMDTWTAELLANVAEQFASARALLLLVGRKVASEASRRIPRCVDVALGPLVPADLERLVQVGGSEDDKSQDLAMAVMERSFGHPLAALELLREGLERGLLQSTEDGGLEVTGGGGWMEQRSLGELLEARVQALEPRQREILSALAVLDEPVLLDALASVTERPLLEVHSVVEELEIKGMVQWLSALSVAFAVQIWAEVVAAATPTSEWRLLHERTAAVYERQRAGEANEVLGETRRLARHYEAAGDAPRAAGLYGASGVALSAMGCTEAALYHFGKALALLPPEFGSLGDITSWLEGIGQSVRYVPEPSIGPVVALAARGVLSGRGQEAIRVELALEAANILLALHQFVGASELVEAALGRTASMPTLARRALSLQGAIAVEQGTYPSAVRALERASLLGPAAPSEQHQLLAGLACALAGVGEYARAAAALAQAEALQLNLEPRLACTRIHARAVLLSAQGEYMASAQAEARAAELARGAGLGLERAQALSGEGAQLVLAAEFPKAFAALKRALVAAEQIGSSRLVTQSRMFLTFLDGLDAMEGAEGQLRGLIAYAAAQKWSADELVGRYLLGRLLTSAGAFAEGGEELRRAQDEASKIGNLRVAELCRTALAAARA